MSSLTIEHLLHVDNGKSRFLDQHKNINEIHVLANEETIKQNSMIKFRKPRLMNMVFNVPCDERCLCNNDRNIES